MSSTKKKPTQAKPRSSRKKKPTQAGPRSSTVDLNEDIFNKIFKEVIGETFTDELGKKLKNVDFLKKTLEANNPSPDFIKWLKMESRMGGSAKNIIKKMKNVLTQEQLTKLKGQNFIKLVLTL